MKRKLKNKKVAFGTRSASFFAYQNKEKGPKKRTNLWLIISGSIMGFLNGFFGGGGGMVCVPILQKVLGLDAKHSHATAIMIIFPLSLISAFIYVINGYISSFPLISVGVGVVCGGILGAFALKFLPPKAVRIIFAVVMFAGGIKLII
ncbi:MAG: sulfite exporter TauE/SafE family protein [Clostridia bacterium]|nr:sulfite exporter TauE/SafE family protein [Clostridia bacterium]